MMLQKNNRAIYLKFFLLTLTFVLPAIVSWFLYSYHDFFHFKTTNRGVLIHPPVQIKEFSASSQKKWQIVYVPSRCDSNESEKIIYTLHQLKKALGKNYDRVNLTVVISASCPLKQVYDFRKIVFSDVSYQAFQNTLKMPVVDKIYLVDPLNNLFMFYPGETNAMNILKDIKKVLEVSQIG